MPAIEPDEGGPRNFILAWTCHVLPGKSMVLSLVSDSTPLTQTESERICGSGAGPPTHSGRLKAVGLTTGESRWDDTGATVGHVCPARNHSFKIREQTAKEVSC